MKKVSLLVVLFFCVVNTYSQRNTHYITNQKPLVEQPYTALPLGNIKPKGWLKHMLELQRDGLTGKLDSIYELVCGPTNGWLGGEGDGWERGPYWVDGLVPLAYILDDKALQEKAQKWIEWSIENQRDDGYFGPLPLEDGYTKINGTQQGNREDWWPKMVMLKILQQYYTATEDKRVLTLMDKYFKYQLKTLEKYPLGHWTYWANRRGGDNLAVVYWLYNITKEKYLLDLAETIHKQTFDWTTVYSDGTIATVSPLPRLHCVNVAQGLKEPIIYYQQHPEDKYKDAVKKGLADLKHVHGFVNGMYGGDEALHGNDPTQGSELCSATEMMFSFESILPITGDVYYADYLEKIAFNVLPTQHDDKFLRKQYFQQANQVQVTDHDRNFFNDSYARIAYGVLTGYPCCTTNMHQGWPKFVQNLWYATADNGLAALVYGASSVTAKVANGTEVSFTEETNYPFDDAISFKFSSEKSVKFPLHLRVPLWAKGHELSINGTSTKINPKNNILIIDRLWKDGDEVKLVLPMEITTSSWYEKSLGIERGPLVYALKIDEKWVEKKTDNFPHSYYDVLPESDWNYGILRNAIEDKTFHFKVEQNVSEMPWNIQNAPLSITVDAAQLPNWKLYNHSSGKIPVRNRINKDKLRKEEITLIPYGCTTLRVSQFPIINIVD